MKVTVCELGNSPEDFAKDWKKLSIHTKEKRSDLILLPEMTFFPWFAWKRPFDSKFWEEAVAAHENIEENLKEIMPAIVLGSRPVNRDDKRLNEGFVWTTDSGYHSAHDKYYLPDEAGFWEASWYDRGDGAFDPFLVGETSIGFAICTEIWFFHHMRSYAKKGVRLIACPRATPTSTLDKWLAAGRVASVVSGAFCLSSNRIGHQEEAADLGGQGWICGPDGGVLGITSQEQPFMTVEIDLKQADKAKQTYPRYVKD
jgi:N-carbamoylputrescine amidase